MKHSIPSDNLLRRVVEQPSEAKAVAGNYRKGHIRLHGLDISIENPRGSIRSGVAANGKRWSNKIHHHYGYVRRTLGKDGDQVDVFIGPHPASFMVFVVDQVNPATGKFDEHKCMLGFHSKEEARKGYLANYDKGWKGLGNITATTIRGFKQWLKEGDMKKPFKDWRMKRIIKKAQLEGLSLPANYGVPSVVSNMYDAVANAETGGESNKWIRTKVQPKGGSTAYGPTQLTRKLSNDYLTRFPNLWDRGEKAYLGRFDEQGKKFVRYGKEPNRKGYEPRFDYGGSGSLTNDTNKAMYRVIAQKIMNKKMQENNDNVYQALKSWRGKSLKEDPRYYERFLHSATNSMPAAYQTQLKDNMVVPLQKLREAAATNKVNQVATPTMR